MVSAAGAAAAVAVFGDGDTEGVGAEMRDLTKEFDWRFRVAIFQFAVCGAHAAQRANLTPGTDGSPRCGNSTDFLEAPFPAGAEIAASYVVAILVGEHANGEVAVGINGAAVMAAAAGIALVGERAVGESTLVVDQPQIFGHANGVMEVQRHGLLRRKPDSQRALRAVDTRIHQGVELELDAKVLLGEALHLKDFVKIDGRWDGFQLERKATLKQKVDSLHAAIKGTGNAGQGLVGLAGCAIDRDFDGKRAIFDEVIGDLRSNHGAVGEERDQEAALFGLGIDIQEVFAREDFAAGIENPKATQIGEFIEQVHMLFEGELRAASIGIAHGEVVVAVLALEGATVSDLDGDFDGRAASLVPFVDQGGEITVCCCLYHLVPFRAISRFSSLRRLDSWRVSGSVQET